MSKFLDYLKEQNLINYEDIKANLSEITSLKIKDSENLYLLKYTKEDNWENDFKKFPFLKDLRSIILEKSTNKVISQSLLFKDSYDEFTDNVSWNDLVVEESIDGTLINLYYYNEKWNISTKGTLDGICYWNSNVTFRDLFLETSKDVLDYDLLKKNYSYSFVLSNKKCRNISNYHTDKITHILSRNMDTLKETDEEIGIIKPKIWKILNINKLENVNNYEDLLKNVNQLDFNTEGYMLYSKDRIYRHKLRSEQFLKVAKIKGNDPFVEKRLLSIMYDSELSKEFLTYFQEYEDLMKRVKEKLDDLSNLIYTFYIKIYIEKKFIDLPIYIRKPIYEINSIYLQKRNNYREGPRAIIRKSDVDEWLKKLDINYKYYLYRYYIDSRDD